MIDGRATGMPQELPFSHEWKGYAEAGGCRRKSRPSVRLKCSRTSIRETIQSLVAERGQDVDEHAIDVGVDDHVRLQPT